MITRSQNSAFVVAHAQPSPIEQAEHRSRGSAGPPGVPSPSSYLTVRVPVMAGIGWTEQMNV